MSNFGVLAILALPKMPERQLRLLLAIETVAAIEGGWRLTTAGLLSDSAGISHNTLASARGELVKAGLLEYRPSRGRGCKSAYRLLFALDRPCAKPPSEPGQFSPQDHPDNPPASLGSFTGAANGRKTTQPGVKKLPTPNALTSDDSNASLEPSSLVPGGHPLTPRKGTPSPLTAPSDGDASAGSAPLAETTQGGPGGRRVLPVTAVDGERSATPLHSLREHNGPENHGSDAQHTSTEVHRQSQTTDRYARERDEKDRAGVA